MSFAERPVPIAVLVVAAWSVTFGGACGGEDDANASGGGGGSTASLGAGAGAGATTSSGTGGTHLPPVCAPSSDGPPPGFFAAPDGSPDGDGSVGAPWDLQTALLHPAAVQPGDTIWLRAGVYAGVFYSKLVGADGAPITVRSYPGEWAVLDGASGDTPGLEIYKAWSVFTDLEIMNSLADRTLVRPSGIYVEGANVKLVHIVVHDTGTGVICNSATDSDPELAPNLEVYGSLFYNNGYLENGEGHGHHLYLQNRDGTKRIADNVIFDSFGFGIHAYSDNDTHWAQNYEIVGNVWWGAGAATPGIGKHFDDCMVGHNGTKPVTGLVVRDNMGWATGPGERDVRLGWSAPNGDVTLEGNHVVGQTIFQPSWQSVTMTGNTFYGDVVGVDTAGFPDNDYVTAAPTESWIFVRPSEYTPGRGLVVVYDWGGAGSAAVDLSTVVPSGSPITIRRAADPFGSPVVETTYKGGTVEIPMTGAPPVQPIGLPDAIDPAETPGKQFDAFVVIGCGAAGP